nr:hypothetical protein [Mesorhizobium sp.]
MPAVLAATVRSGSTAISAGFAALAGARSAFTSASSARPSTGSPCAASKAQIALIVT